MLPANPVMAEGEAAMANKVLVLGATGNVGRPLVAKLLEAKAGVKAASRRATPVAGAEAVRFDYTDQSTLPAAFEGVDRVFVMLPGGYTDPVGHLKPVIQAAADRRIKVVLQTAIGVDADEAIPYRQVERVLMGSGAPYVILRPNWFADNFHTYWLPGIKQGVLAVPAGDGQSSFIDVRDVAAGIAAVLTTNRYDGSAFNLTGPKAYSYGDAAAIISRTAGRPVRYTPVGDDAFIDMLTGAGVPEEYARFLTSIFQPVRQGWTAAVTTDVESLTGQTPRPLETYVADHAAAFRAG
jgi:uncharacterized protein YbjT (DUF2867 family)